MDKKSKDGLKIKLSGLLPELNERQRRLVVGAEAQSLGYGGIKILAEITGITPPTIRRGIQDLNAKNINEMMPQIEKKIDFFKDVIQKTVIHVQKNKFLDILGISDVCSCIERLGELSKKINEFNDHKSNYDTIVNGLQTINNELSTLLKNYGT